MADGEDNTLDLLKSLFGGDQAPADEIYAQQAGGRPLDLANNPPLGMGGESPAAPVEPGLGGLTGAAGKGGDGGNILARLRQTIGAKNGKFNQATGALSKGLAGMAHGDGKGKWGAFAKGFGQAHQAANAFSNSQSAQDLARQKFQFDQTMKLLGLDIQRRSADRSDRTEERATARDARQTENDRERLRQGDERNKIYRDVGRGKVSSGIDAMDKAARIIAAEKKLLDSKIEENDALPRAQRWSPEERAKKLAERDTALEAVRAKTERERKRGGTAVLPPAEDDDEEEGPMAGGPDEPNPAIPSATPGVAKPAAPSVPNQPDSWVKTRDKDTGKPVWFNPATRKTRSDDPAAAPVDAPAPAQLPGASLKYPMLAPTNAGGDPMGAGGVPDPLPPPDNRGDAGSALPNLGPQMAGGGGGGGGGEIESLLQQLFGSGEMA